MGQVRHGSATTRHAVRAAISESEATVHQNAALFDETIRTCRSLTADMNDVEESLRIFRLGDVEPFVQLRVGIA
ncbi:MULTISPECIES: hypothetical protein [Roseobacteraceae]|uniref:Uncharacterized protein n=1 Tax=Pseudosulfitobacter pseudonitzschiae TaxID=1402135 RepID=A0A221K603_9RHOB|nr:MULTISPECIES: hypothetical protein [Roseobacteraceae]ASM74287.1 hypothetical protein SULPSESMR1_03516 [Pseudosulfitobacter pseudonitzschiae]